MSEPRLSVRVALVESFHCSAYRDTTCLEQGADPAERCLRCTLLMLPDEKPERVTLLEGLLGRARGATLAYVERCDHQDCEEIAVSFEGGSFAQEERYCAKHAYANNPWPPAVEIIACMAEIDRALEPKA